MIAVATKVYNNKEAPKGQQIRGLAKVLLADKSWGLDGQRERRLSQVPQGQGGDKGHVHPLFRINQCAYFKERGHWKKKRPQRKRAQRACNWQVQTEGGGI